MFSLLRRVLYGFIDIYIFMGYVLLANNIYV